MPDKDSLASYRGKRHARRTPEPMGSRPRRRARAPRFVIQKHDATTLHYDFRLEARGVLKSWAVPKGPSTNPKDKRLATPTEDHPLDYAEFEGVIPEGEYGAGPVIVWDTGTYRNLTERDGRKRPVDRAVQDGHVTVWLEGTKLTEAFTLTRMGRGRRDWLLVKKKDEGADARRNLLSSRPESATSGRTIEEVAGRANPRRSRSKRRAAQ